MKLLKNERIAWLDIAKAITIILVVFGHTLRGGIAQRIVYSFHVATFFLLSGMTCKVDCIAKRIKNDFLRLLFPYYSFGIISIIIFSILGEFAASRLDLSIDNSIVNNLWQLIYACPKSGKMKFNVPLWFLPCLFATKLLYYAIHKIFHGRQLPTLVCSLSLACLSFASTSASSIDFPFNLSVSVKMLAFFSLGRYIIFNIPASEKGKPGRTKYLFFGIMTIAITAVLACLSPKVDYASDSFPNIVAFLATSALGSLGMCLISKGIEKSVVLEYIGKSSLAILVMHKFPVLLFQTVLPTKQVLTQYNSLLGIAGAVLVTTIAIGLCIVAQWVINRVCPWLLGRKSKGI